MKAKYLIPSLAALTVLILVIAVFVFAQTTVVPFMGVGNVQFFDNNGNPLTAGVLYTYQAGTTTYQSTYTDSTGTVLNTNPIAFGSGGRVSIWLMSGATYKYVLCVQNDGASCAPGDVLFSMDQVPASSGSGGGGSSPFTGTFISGSASPSTTGILRLASGDGICFRNAANSGNICITKDSNDILTWAGGSLKFPQIVAPTCSAAGLDCLWADSTANRWMMANNGGGATQIVGAGVDINTSDQVTQVHFGATAVPFNAAAPTTGQYLQFNGTSIIGGNTSLFDLTLTGIGVNGGVNTCAAAATGAVTFYCQYYIFPNAHTLVRFILYTAASGACTTNGTWGVYDVTASTLLASYSPVAPGVHDSGVLAVNVPAAHTIGIGLTTVDTGCGGNHWTAQPTAVLE